MRTSEIIMLIFCSRSTSRARSPEETGTVSNPWLDRKESSRLRWAGVVIHNEKRGGVFELEDSGGTSSILVIELDMGNAKERAGRFVGQALDFPAVREDDLLHDRQAQAGPFLIGGEVGLENLRAILRRHARAVVGNFDERLFVVAPAGADDGLSPWPGRPGWR